MGTIKMQEIILCHFCLSALALSWWDKSHVLICSPIPANTLSWWGKSQVLIFSVLLASFPLILVHQLFFASFTKNSSVSPKKRRGIHLHLPAKLTDFGLTSVCKQTQNYKKRATRKQVTRGKYGLFRLLYPEQELGWTAMAANNKWFGEGEGEDDLEPGIASDLVVSQRALMILPTVSFFTLHAYNSILYSALLVAPKSSCVVPK